MPIAGDCEDAEILATIYVRRTAIVPITTISSRETAVGRRKMPTPKITAATATIS